MTGKQALFAPLSPQPGLTEAIAARLAEDIVSGRLGSRNRLPSVKDMAAQFGVSQTVIREAMARLRADGLVVARHGSGVYVADDPRGRPLRIDPRSVTTIHAVMGIMEVRLGLEVEAAGVAAERRSERQLRAIGAALDAIGRAAAEGKPAVDEDYEFHAAIATATGNPHFSMLLEFLGRYIIPRQRVRVGRGTLSEQNRYLAKIQREHEAIHAAIATGNVAAARNAMRRHLLHGLNRLQKLEESTAP